MTDRRALSGCLKDGDKMVKLFLEEALDKRRFQKNLDPLQPKISMYILQTVLCTFPIILTMRICLL